MRGFPAMDAGERAYARLTGSARARGFPAMRDARTAGELTGGAWRRKPQDWALGVDSKRRQLERSEPGATTAELQEAQDSKAHVAPLSQGFTLGPESSAAYQAGRELETAVVNLTPVTWSSWGPRPPDQATAPTSPAPTDPVEPVEPTNWGDFGFGMGLPPDPAPPPARPPATSTPASSSSSSSSAGSALTIGALLAAVFFS